MCDYDDEKICSNGSSVHPSDSGASFEKFSSVDRKIDFNIKCMSANVDCLQNKMTELRNLIEISPMDIIALTEVNSKNKDREDLENFVLEGYTCITEKKGRGVSLLIREKYDVMRLADVEEMFQPSIICKITVQGSRDPFIFAVMYRSPSLTAEDNDKLNRQVNSLLSQYSQKNVIITGDFNYPDINWTKETCLTRETHCAYKFFETVQENFTLQLIKEPTHHRGEQTPNILDLLLVNKEDLIQNVELQAPIGKSHHSIIYFDISGNSDIPVNDSTTKRQLSKGDYDGMREYIKQTDWSEILVEDSSVDDCWSGIKSVLTDAMDKYIPCKKSRVNGKPRREPLPETLLDKVRLKRRLYKYWKKYRTVQNWNAYAKVRNQVNWMSNKHEIDKEKKLAKEAKTNLKCFFDYVSRKSKPREGVANLSKPDGNLTENDQEKAEVLNNFFTSVFTTEDQENIPTFDCGKNVSIDNITKLPEQMKKALSQLKVSKSPGPDGIHPRILKELADELSYPLTFLFHKTMISGKIPKEWKVAEVRPIFKKGEKSAPGNYRPVSLTSIICKVFEGFVRDRLSDHLLDNELLYVYQYGFTRGRSTVTQLLTTINDWMKEIDIGNPVDAIYLDLRKAFDTVPHQRLVNKLDGYGVKGNILAWVHDFLSNRTQHVKINNSSSDSVPVTSGVPQGSVLGPILFIYYINDMPDLVNCSMKIFADDTKVYSQVPTPELRDKLQQCIDKMMEWTDTWLLRFNTSKCKVLHIGKNNPQYDYYMTDGNSRNKLDSTVAEKDLGVIIDPNLDFDNHISATVKKANRLSGMLMRNITYKHKDIILPLYKSLIRSVLEYGNPVWNPHLRKHINLIEGVQRRITKCIIGTKNMSYEERLAFLKLPSLEFRRLRGCLIEVYKILHGFYDTKTTTNLFQLASSSTRGHNFKLTKHATNTNIFKNYFTNSMINTWNNLSKETVNAPSVNAFKNRIDRELRDYMSLTGLSFLCR